MGELSGLRRIGDSVNYPRRRPSVGIRRIPGNRMPYRRGRNCTLSVEPGFAGMTRNLRLYVCGRQFASEK